MFYVNPLSFSNKLLNRVEIKLGRSRLLSRPVELTLEPTLQCNSNCVMCNRNFSRKETKEETGFLSWETFGKVKPFFKYAERVLFGGFGESLLHPDYLAMLKEIKAEGPYVYFFTNGILLSGEVGRQLVDNDMDMICVSMGGATRETYQKIRGTDAFERVVANIRELTQYKRKTGKTKPLLSFNVVAMKSLLPEMEALVELAHDIGVEHIAMPNLVAQGDELRSESPWLCLEKSQKSFQKAADLAGKYNITFIPPNLAASGSGCNALFNRLNINWDGSIMSCAMERYLIGDLNEKSIGEIWNGNGMKSLRRQIVEQGLEASCPRCTCWDNRPETFLDPWINSRKHAKRIS